VSMVDPMLEPPRPVRRLEVITGAGGRRRWSADEKARILEEAMAPGAVVSEVARRNGLSPQHLFTWRRQAKREADNHPLAFTPCPASISLSDIASTVMSGRRSGAGRA
jgi:transposase